MKINFFLGQGKVREFFIGQEVQMQGFIHHSLSQSANSVIETVAKLPDQFNRIYTKALPGLSFCKASDNMKIGTAYRRARRSLQCCPQLQSIGIE